MYLSREETRWVAQHLGVGSAAGAGTAASVASGCGRLTLVHWVAGTACFASAAVYGRAFVNATETAVRRERCLRIRYTNRSQAPVIVGFYDDGGRHCKD